MPLVNAKKFVSSTCQQDLIDRYNNCDYEERINNLIKKDVIPNTIGSFNAQTTAATAVVVVDDDDGDDGIVDGARGATTTSADVDVDVDVDVNNELDTSDDGSVVAKKAYSPITSSSGVSSSSSSSSSSSMEYISQFNSNVSSSSTSFLSTSQMELEQQQQPVQPQPQPQQQQQQQFSMLPISMLNNEMVVTTTIDPQNYAAYACMMYDHFFRQSMNTYVSFDTIGSIDIPYLVKKMQYLDFSNFKEVYPSYIFRTNTVYDANIANFCILNQYLSSKEFCVDLLTSTKHDHVVGAIISYVLLWNDSSILKYIALYPEHRNFLTSIMDFRRLDNGAYVYSYEGIPFVRAPIKLLKAQFKHITEPRHSFDWMALISHKFIQHLTHVYGLILNDTFTYDSIASLLDVDMEIPYMLPNFDMSQLLVDRKYKFISGQACCCKTTVLNRLKSYGWRTFSRGDVGSFGGKATNPAAMGNLHAALNTILTLPDVIGGMYIYIHTHNTCVIILLNLLETENCRFFHPFPPFVG